ncbi:hypothetical protein GMLC_04210 [Geomonas limicola]|uniref:Prepilin-type N-terminal cleavage/methylation domain-containing protein n=1 Tax=Geomonas limicola TaxID=2740186 RepID=A0A6V8N2U2_9BACT|nr:type II secretion system protein [Geomonas limicola]GFO66842.1 hypothetical protein GMLC_04210 [Geomonas limicola]
MKKVRRDSGFTLVEIMVVVAIFGIVMASVFSVYLTHMKNAYKQDDAVETQQNLRIALDALTRDLKMAGMLVPITTPPLAAGVWGAYSSCLRINTSSPTGTYARIGISRSTSGYSNFSTQLDTSEAVDGFQVGDRVRLIRPFDNSQPLGSVVQANYSTMVISPVLAPNRVTRSISLQYGSGAAFPVGSAVNSSDMLAKAAGSRAFDTVDYSLVTSASNPDCPTGMACLARSVNSRTAEVVASNIKSLRFSYLFDDVSGVAETNAVTSSNLSSIKAVRVTITGTTPRGGSAASAKQLSTVVGLRNRRGY